MGFPAVDPSGNQAEAPDFDADIHARVYEAMCHRRRSEMLEFSAVLDVAAFSPHEFKGCSQQSTLAPTDAEIEAYVAEAAESWANPQSTIHDRWYSDAF